MFTPVLRVVRFWSEMSITSNGVRTIWRLTTWASGGPEVMVSRAMDAARVRALADEHGAVAVVAAPAGYQDEASLAVAQLDAWLPDWAGSGEVRRKPGR